MKKILTLFTLFLLAAVFAGTSAAQDRLDPADLTYMAENYPPANYVENGEFKGASVELLRGIWEKMGVPEQPIRIMPWARAYDTLQKRADHVLFTMSRTEKREDLFKWVGPIFKARHVLVGLKGKDFKIDRLKDAQKYRIGVIRGDIGETFLLEAGFDENRLDSVAQLEQNFRKLLNGRVDLIAQSEDAVREIIGMKNYDPDRFETYFVVNETGNYYAFNKETPDAVIEKFQKTLDAIEEIHKKILEKYNMSL